jgi:hypothetical protein
MQRLIYMGGEGGTGKSRVIEAIIYYFTENNKKHELLVAAPTGAAACLINGETIHRLMKFGRLSLKKSTKKTATIIRKLQAGWKNVRFLIIDEISMISQELINEINGTLQLAKDNDLPFGGLTILFSGDFAQLPPFNATALYVRSLIEKGKLLNLNISQKKGAAENGRMAWLGLTHAITLVEQMRQSADIQFKQILQRLRSNSSNSEELQLDFNLLTSKIINKHTDLSNWTDAVILVARNYLRQKLNYVKNRLFAKQNNTNVIICKAKDRLTKNGCSKALNNRVISMIKVLEEKDTANMMTELPPACLLLKKINCNYNNSSFAYLPSDIIPLFPREESFYVNPKCPELGTRTVSVKRIQFPLTPAYACTAHKAQGKTLSKAIIDLSIPTTGRLDSAYAYVVLSRLKCLKDFLILRHFPISVLHQKHCPDYWLELNRLY